MSVSLVPGPSMKQYPAYSECQINIYQWPDSVGHETCADRFVLSLAFYSVSVWDGSVGTLVSGVMDDLALVQCLSLTQDSLI